MSEQCGSCKLVHESVECGGIYYCPNPHCEGSGGTWFRSTLSSYVDLGMHHTVDPEEWREAADRWENGKWKGKKWKKYAQVNWTDTEVDRLFLEIEKKIDEIESICDDLQRLQKKMTKEKNVRLEWMVGDV